MSVPSKRRWRWKLLLSSGSLPCLIIPETTEETLSWCYFSTATKTVCFAANLFTWRNKTVAKAFVEIQRNTLKQSLWRFTPFKAKSNVSLLCWRKDDQLWHFSCKFPRTSLSICIKGMKRNDFQGTMCFNLTIPNVFQCKKKRNKSGTVWGSVRFISSPHTFWNGLDACALFMMLNLGFCNSSQSWNFSDWPI